MEKTVINCPVHAALDVLGGKWKLVVLHHLADGQPKRFKVLERFIKHITPRMLIKELKDLEEHGLVRRQAYATVPPTVEYSLTEYGMTLIPVVLAIEKWGKEHGTKLRSQASVH